MIVFFGGTYSHAELDLIILKNGKRLGFEFKYTDSPKITKSMKIAMEDLQLKEIILIYPGTKSFPLSKQIKAEGLKNYILSKKII